MKNARTKHLDFIIGDMLALGMAQFLMMILNQDKLNRVLYTYYIQLGILLVVITLSVAFMTDGYSNILHRGYLKEMIAVSRQMTITFAVEVICLFAFQLSGLFSRVVLFAIFVLGILFIYGERLLPEKEIPENQICPDDHGDRHKTAGRSFDRAFVCQGFFSLSYPGTSGY